MDIQVIGNSLHRVSMPHVGLIDQFIAVCALPLSSFLESGGLPGGSPDFLKRHLRFKLVFIRIPAWNQTLNKSFTLSEFC
jgi:hypothetical protein